MPVVISDETLRAANMSEPEARIEIACRLFDAGKLQLWPAAQLAGLPRVEMEAELQRRKIPVFRPTVEDLRADVEALRKLGI